MGDDKPQSAGLKQREVLNQSPVPTWPLSYMACRSTSSDCKLSKSMAIVAERLNGTDC